MTAHLIGSSLCDMSDTVFTYGCYSSVHSFACSDLQRVEHSRAGAPKPRQPSYGAGHSDRSAYSYSDRDRGRSDRDRRCVPRKYPLRTLHNAPAVMMSHVGQWHQCLQSSTQPCLQLTPVLRVCWLGGRLPLAPYNYSSCHTHCSCKPM